MKTTIDSRTYTVEVLEVGQLVAADLAGRGWEPRYYVATGVRGAVFLAVRCAKTGRFARS
jgi:hypothetical protein